MTSIPCLRTKLHAFPCFADGTGGDDGADSLGPESLGASFFTFFSTESLCNGLESPFSSRLEGAGEWES